MRIEPDQASGAVRLDDEGFAALVDPIAHPGHPEAFAVLDSEPWRAALPTVGRPLVTLQLTVAGGGAATLQHRMWVDLEHAVLLLGLRPGSYQLVAQPPSSVTAALVRLTRLAPRRTDERTTIDFASADLADLVEDDPERRTAALAAAGAEFAWQLTVAWSGESRQLTAVDGQHGLFVAEPESDTLIPMSNTGAYRIFSTVLPRDPVGSADD